LPKIAEDGNSLQDKQWTPTGAGPVVPEEEEEEEEEESDYCVISRGRVKRGSGKRGSGKRGTR